jgi:hypothetical protein
MPDDERAKLDYATLDPDLARPRGPAPWRMYLRDIALAVLIGAAFSGAAIYLVNRFIAD